MGQSNAFSRVMYATESTLGTAVTRTEELSRLQNCALTEENNFIYERGIGEGVNIVKTYYGNYLARIAGSINVNDFDFFKYFIGPKTGAGTSGDKYTLTEATAGNINDTNALDSFTMELANVTESTSDVEIVSGCVGNSFTLAGSLGRILTANFDIFGQKTVHGTSATSYTAVTLDSYVMINGTWKWGATPTAYSGLREFTLNYTNGFSPEEFFISTSRLMQNVTLPAGRGYTGSVTVVTSQSLADTIYTNFYGQTPTSGPETGSTAVVPTADLEFKIELVNGANYANIWLDQCSIDNISRPIDLGQGLRLMTFDYTAKAGQSNTPITWWSV